MQLCKENWGQPATINCHWGRLENGDDLSIPTPKQVTSKQRLCNIIPITLSDTITLRVPAHKEGLKPELGARAKNKHGIRSCSLFLLWDRSKL